MKGGFSHFVVQDRAKKSCKAECLLPHDEHKNSAPESTVFLSLCRGASGHLRWVKDRLLVPRLVLATFAGHIALAAPLNLLVAPTAGPSHRVPLDPVVRATREAPVADRGVEGHGLTIKAERPVRWSERRHHLVPASAATQMARRGKLDGDVELPPLQPFGDVLHELVRQAVGITHTCPRSSSRSHRSCTLNGALAPGRGRTLGASSSESLPVSH